ncbi:MAG: DUF4038 domain-containing protein [Aurantibacter sp.]
MKFYIYAIGTLFLPLLALAQTDLEIIPQWTSHEIILTATSEYENAYTDVDVWAEFIDQNGTILKRPAFWDGSNTWKLRFAPPRADEEWTWQTFASNAKDEGLHGIQGRFKSIAYSGDNTLLKNGLLKMSPRFRNVVHHSGKSFLVVGDTPWAIPFRATREQVEIYAQDRQKKGFNVALMMTLQPDTKAEGPNERNTEKGFKRAFEDLSDGHIDQINVDYFQYYDDIVQTLLKHEIVPVFQPVFHGYGWKGLQVLGRTIEPEEYVRYCKYLLARYGSGPAFWLLGGDHNGKDPGVLQSGEMMQEWDCYAQPTGIHYNPCDDYLASWANGEREHCFHYNKTFQEKEWLDFQWAQTGHDSKHLYHKVERMYDNLPTKAVANGEPTYEGMNDGKNGLGWWQGEEAWMQLMHGGTMGVVYGAATLWQWKISPAEEGWPAWTDQPTSWQEAMRMEGSTYVGLVGKILEGINMSDIEKRWDLSDGKPLLAKEGRLYISYLNKGGEIAIKGIPSDLNYSWIDPRTGEPAQMGKITANSFRAPDKNPWVLIIK